jgi:hypothetical protein
MSKNHGRTEIIDGIQVTFHTARSGLIAVAECPICGSPEDTSQKSPNIGEIVAERVNRHIQMSHPDSPQAKNRTKISN